jgi:hypothetical protein
VIKFSDAWVSAAFGVYLVDLGVLHGWIRRHQRTYAGVVRRLEALEPEATASRADVEALRSLERRVALGWAVFNVLVVGAVFLMVFKPGS